MFSDNFIAVQPFPHAYVRSHSWLRPKPNPASPSSREDSQVDDIHCMFVLKITGVSPLFRVPQLEESGDGESWGWPGAVPGSNPTAVDDTGVETLRRDKGSDSRHQPTSGLDPIPAGRPIAGSEQESGQHGMWSSGARDSLGAALPSPGPLERSRLSGVGAGSVLSAGPALQSMPISYTRSTASRPLSHHHRGPMPVHPQQLPFSGPTGVVHHWLYSRARKAGDLRALMDSLAKSWGKWGNRGGTWTAARARDAVMFVANAVGTFPQAALHEPIPGHGPMKDENVSTDDTGAADQGAGDSKTLQHPFLVQVPTSEYDPMWGSVGRWGRRGQGLVVHPHHGVPITAAPEAVAAGLITGIGAALHQRGHQMNDETGSSAMEGLAAVKHVLSSRQLLVHAELWSLVQQSLSSMWLSGLHGWASHVASTFGPQFTLSFEFATFPLLPQPLFPVRSVCALVCFALRLQPILLCLSCCMSLLLLQYLSPRHEAFLSVYQEGDTESAASDGSHPYDQSQRHRSSSLDLKPPSSFTRSALLGSTSAPDGHREQLLHHSAPAGPQGHNASFRGGLVRPDSQDVTASPASHHMNPPLWHFQHAAMGMPFWPSGGPAPTPDQDIPAWPRPPGPFPYAAPPSAQGWSPSWPHMPAVGGAPPFVASRGSFVTTPSPADAGGGSFAGSQHTALKQSATPPTKSQPWFRQGRDDTLLPSTSNAARSRLYSQVTQDDMLLSLGHRRSQLLWSWLDRVNSSQPLVEILSVERGAKVPRKDLPRRQSDSGKTTPVRVSFTPAVQRSVEKPKSEQRRDDSNNSGYASSCTDDDQSEDDESVGGTGSVCSSLTATTAGTAGETASTCSGGSKRLRRKNRPKTSKWKAAKRSRRKRQNREKKKHGSSTASVGLGSVEEGGHSSGHEGDSERQGSKVRQRPRTKKMSEEEKVRRGLSQSWEGGDSVVDDTHSYVGSELDSEYWEVHGGIAHGSITGSVAESLNESVGDWEGARASTVDAADPQSPTAELDGYGSSVSRQQRRPRGSSMEETASTASSKLKGIGRRGSVDTADSLVELKLTRSVSGDGVSGRAAVSALGSSKSLSKLDRMSWADLVRSKDDARSRPQSQQSSASSTPSSATARTRFASDDGWLPARATARKMKGGRDKHTTRGRVKGRSGRQPARGRSSVTSE